MNQFVKKEKTLILLTKTFPYGVGESFIEDEIQYLSKAFERVIIIPTVAGLSMKCRCVPCNCSVYVGGDLATHRLYKYVRGIVKSAVLWCTSYELRNELKKANGLRNKLIVMYYYGQAKTDKKTVAKAIKKESLDRITTIYSYWFNDLALTAAFVKREQKKKQTPTIRTISRAHGYDLYADRIVINEIPFKSVCMQEMDKVYPCSANGTAYLSKRYPNYASKIETAYLGTPDRGLNIRDKRIFTLVTCSSIIPLKRIRLVAQAVALLEKEGVCSLRWICIGDGSELCVIQKYVAENISKVQCIFKGQIGRDEVLNTYAAESIDVLINVSESEGLPVSIMEALSFGIPCIASAIIGNAEIISQNENGYLVSENPDAKELANAIGNMMELSEPAISELRKNARKAWESRFWAENNYTKFADSISESK